MGESDAARDFCIEKSTAPIKAAESGGVSGLVVGCPDGYERGSRGVSSPEFEAEQEGAVRGELLAGGRALARCEVDRDPGDARPVVRRAEGYHPASDFRTAEVPDPEPGDDATGRVADHVH